MPRTGKFGLAKLASKDAMRHAKVDGFVWTWESIRQQAGAQLIAATNDGRNYGVHMEETTADVDYDYLQFRLDVTIWLIDWKDCKVGEHTAMPLWDGMHKQQQFVRDGTLWQRTV